MEVTCLESQRWPLCHHGFGLGAPSVLRELQVKVLFAKWPPLKEQESGQESHSLFNWGSANNCNNKKPLPLIFHDSQTLPKLFYSHGLTQLTRQCKRSNIPHVPIKSLLSEKMSCVVALYSQETYRDLL